MAPRDDVTLQLGDVQAIQCSGRDVVREMELLQRSFEEKNDWKRRLGALKRLQGLVLGSSEALRPALPRCREALLSQVQDLRSTLVREACATLQLMACTFRSDFEFFAVPALPVLLKSTSVTILIIAESCNQCATAMVRECRTSRVLQVLLDQCRVKNGTQRCRAMQLLLVTLQNYPITILERHIGSIEKVLKDSLEDPHAGVRTAARNCFWAFEQKFQERGQRFLSCLDAVRQRHLRLLSTLEQEPDAGPVLLGTKGCADTKPEKDSKPKRHRLIAWSEELHLPVPTPGSSSSRSTNEGCREHDATELSGGSTLEGSQCNQEVEIHEKPYLSVASVPTVEPDPNEEQETVSDSSSESDWSLEQMQHAPLERQRELLRAMGKVIHRDEETLKLLEIFVEMRPLVLEGAVLTDLLQNLLQGCPAATKNLAHPAVRILRRLYLTDGQKFRAAAGDLHPLPFNALTALLPELSAVDEPAIEVEKLPAPANWAKEGHRALVVALKGLASSNHQAQASSLESLQDLMQHPECCEDFAEVLVSKLFQCHAVSGSQLQRQVLRLLEKILSSILPLRAMEILLPLVAEADLALSLLPLSLRRLPPRQALDHLVLILPALSTVLSGEAAETRKAAILCLVELYLSVGQPAMEIFEKELAPSQLKLVVMYAERQRSPQSSNGSPKLNSSPEHFKLD